MDKYFVFTDFDLDGSGSYTCLTWLLGGPIPYRGSTVKNFDTDFKSWLTTNKISDYKKIFILDIDVSKFKDLIDYENVIIVDHHASHKNVYTKAVSILKPVTSNVELLRQTLLKNVNLTESQKLLINIIDGYDCYRLDDSRSLMLNTLFWQYRGDRIKQFYADFNTGFTEFNVQQKNIIILELKKLQEYFATTPIYYNKNADYTVAAMFGNFSVNELADHVLKKTQCDLACIVNTKAKRIYFRRKKTSSVPITKMVEDITDLKGEGHDNACSTPLTEKFLEYTKQLSVYEKT